VTAKNFTIRPATWSNDAAAIKAVRHKVFIEEQKVPEQLESDHYDTKSEYVVAKANDGQAIGCARLQPDGKVTRIAVLENWRRLGIGSEMLKELISIAKHRQQKTLYMHAQVQAKALYEAFGFKVSGDVFVEAGIEHVKMMRDL